MYKQQSDKRLAAGKEGWGDQIKTKSKTKKQRRKQIKGYEIGRRKQNGEFSFRNGGRKQASVFQFSKGRETFFLFYSGYKGTKDCHETGGRGAITAQSCKHGRSPAPYIAVYTCRPIE